MATIVLLDLMGGVALLLWGLHMVQSGILRAFGPELRRLLSRAFGNRLAAFLAGFGLTAVLQSSTATRLMTASLAAEGAVGLIPALAIMLGANVGTTLIVQVLSLKVSAAAPVLFVLGLVAFRSGSRSWLKDVGRIAIGVGLMLLALHILIDTLSPAEDAPGIRILLGVITFVDTASIADVGRTVSAIMQLDFKDKGVLTGRAHRSLARWRHAGREGLVWRLAAGPP